MACATHLVIIFCRTISLNSPGKKDMYSVSILAICVMLKSIPRNRRDDGPRPFATSHSTKSVSRQRITAVRQRSSSGMGVLFFSWGISDSLKNLKHTKRYDLWLGVLTMPNLETPHKIVIRKLVFLLNTESGWISWMLLMPKELMSEEEKLQRLVNHMN